MWSPFNDRPSALSRLDFQSTYEKQVPKLPRIKTEAAGRKLEINLVGHPFLSLTPSLPVFLLLCIHEIGIKHLLSNSSQTCYLPPPPALAAAVYYTDWQSYFRVPLFYNFIVHGSRRYRSNQYLTCSPHLAPADNRIKDEGIRPDQPKRGLSFPYSCNVAALSTPTFYGHFCLSYASIVLLSPLPHSFLSLLLCFFSSFLPACFRTSSKLETTFLSFPIFNLSGCLGRLGARIVDGDISSTVSSTPFFSLHIYLSAFPRLLRFFLFFSLCTAPFSFLFGCPQRPTEDIKATQFENGKRLNSISNPVQS